MRTRRLAKIARALLAGVLIAPIISVFMPTQSAVAASGDGLQFYWKNETGASKDLTASAFYTGTCATAVAGINFSWGGGSPVGCNTEGFTTYGIGYLLAPTTGSVTFLANGKAIPGCTALKTTGSTPNFVSTCSYRPTSLGNITISATITPNDSGYLAATKSIKVIVRPK